jgi:hypothetical protein
MGKLGSLRFLSFEDTSIMSLPAEFRQLPLKLVRGTQWFAALVFTDYVEMNTQIWSLTVALDRLLAPNRNASRTDAEKMAAKIDGLKKDLNLALQTELDSFYNRVNITH